MFNLNDKYDKIVVVDPGKNAVKSFLFDTNYDLLDVNIFPSKTVQRRTFNNVDNGDGVYQVEMQDESGKMGKFIVGDGAGTYNLDTTKINFHHKLCIYTAIGHYIKNNEKILLLVGFPTSDFNNEAQKKIYKELLQSDKTVKMSINGEEKCFEIADISIMSEGMAIKQKLANTGRVLQIIDIGGQNTNYRRYNAKGTSLKTFSLDNAGMNILVDKIKTTLRECIPADKYDLEYIDYNKVIADCNVEEIDDEDVVGYDSLHELIEDVVLTFVEDQIIGQLRSNGVDIKSRGSLIIFTGGGSKALKNYLDMELTENKGNMLFSETAQWDNCISYTVRDMLNRGQEYGDTHEDSKKALMNYLRFNTSKIFKETELNALELLSGLK